MNELKLFSFKASLKGKFFLCFDDSSIEEDYRNSKNTQENENYPLFIKIFFLVSLMEALGQHLCSCSRATITLSKAVMVYASFIISLYLVLSYRKGVKCKLLLAVECMLMNGILLEKAAIADMSLMGFTVCNKSDIHIMVFAFSLITDVAFSRCIHTGIRKNSMISVIFLSYSIIRIYHQGTMNYINASAFTYITLKLTTLFFVYSLEKIDRKNFLISRELKSQFTSWKSLFLETKNPIIILNKSGIVLCNNDFQSYFNLKTDTPEQNEEAYKILSVLTNGKQTLKEVVSSLIVGNMITLTNRGNLGIFIYESGALSLTFELSYKYLYWKQAPSLYITFKDITETINKEREKISKKYRDILLTTTSHEIRNPLNGILGSLELLKLGKTIETTPENDTLIDAIVSNSELLSNVINCLSDYCKYEAGTLEPDNSNFSLKDLMQSCIYLFQSQAESKRIQITISVPHDIPEIIYSDRARVKQIILNLLSNSIKYTPANGRIILRALFKDPSIEISIIDTGLGIDLKIQSSLFKLFGRVESKSMGSTGIDSGSRAGLGLTISHAIALMLGNGITFSSKENKGSVFKFEIKHLDMSHSMRKSNALAKDGEGFNSNENLFSSFILPKLERNNSGVLEEVENIRKMQFENQIHQVFQKQNSQERIEVLHVVENEEQDFEIVEAEEAKENTSDVEEGLVNEKQLLGYKKKNISLVYNSPIKLSPFIKSKSMSIIIPANSLKECKCAPIIIVDDLSFNLMVLEGFLKKMGLAAARAYNGKEAYELIDSYSKCKCETLKGVLTDIEMPVMNGFEFAKEARAMMKSGKWKTVPIMAVTAYSDEGTREKCVDVGISECLSKPVVIADLRNILRKYDII